jgi:hypothetical protein
VPHEEVPAEPPATGAEPKSLSPTSIRIRSRGSPSVSAAICASTVRAPVPMSVAPTSILTVPSPSRLACAVQGRFRAG